VNEPHHDPLAAAKGIVYAALWGLAFWLGLFDLAVWLSQR
jgi:hypothetical protein